MDEVRQRIERFYAAADRHDWHAAVAELHPAVIYTPVEEDVICRGRDAIAAYFERWYGTWDDDRTDPEVIEISASGDRSFVAMHFTARGKGGGTPVDGYFFHVIDLRDGWLHQFREYQDEDEARAAYLAAEK